MSGATSEIRSILLDQADKLFADHATKAVIDDAEQGAWPDGLWSALEDAGLTRAAVPENHDGAGATFEDAMALLRLAGRYACPVPLGETLIAGWLLGRCGVTPPTGPITFASDTASAPLTLNGKSLNGTARRVPWARANTTVVAVATDEHGTAKVVHVPGDTGTISEGKNIAGEARDDVVFDNVSVGADRIGTLPNDTGADVLNTLGALSRAVLIAGALERVLDFSVAHALDRQQFGRPIAKFQAVQQQLAVLAGETAAAGTAADAAVEAVELTADQSSVLFQIAAAKVRAGEAAGEAATIAHQVHGAMGFTYEHPLHQLTRRLWAWRDEFGTDADWAITLGTVAAENGADHLWPLITAS